jgi:hypothetical protein
MEDIMTRIVALVLTTALVGSGCAQRSARFAVHVETQPQAARTTKDSVRQRDPEVWRRYINSLPLGTTVKADLADGTRLTGTLLGVENDAVIVQPRTRLPAPDRRIAFDMIVSLAPDAGNLSVGKAIAIGVGAGAASFIALFLIAIGALGD